MDHCCSGLKQSGFVPPSGFLAMPATGQTYFRMQRSGEPGKCHSSLWSRAEQERMGVGLITHRQWLPLDLTPQERAPGARGSHADSNQTVQGLRHIRSLSTSLASRNIPASSPGPLKFMSSKMPPPPSCWVLHIIQGPVCHLFYEDFSNFQSDRAHSCHYLFSHLGFDGSYLPIPSLLIDYQG